MSCDPLFWILGHGPLLPRSSNTCVLTTNLGIFLNVELRVQLLAAGLQIAQIQKSCLFIILLPCPVPTTAQTSAALAHADYPIIAPRCLSNASLLFFFACVHGQMYVYIHVGVCTCAHVNVEDRGQYRCLPQSPPFFFF